LRFLPTKQKNENVLLTRKKHEEEDIVRIKGKPQKNNYTERLQYFIEPVAGNNAKIAVAWEQLKIEFELKNYKIAVLSRKI